MDSQAYQRVGVAGSGTIGCGLAACASVAGEVMLLARGASSAERARRRLAEECERLEGSDAGHVRLVTDRAELAGCDLVVEAITEELAAKGRLLAELAEACPGADLASTTSSLPLTELGRLSRAPERLFGLHVFNPVSRMELVELCFPEPVAEAVRARARSWCELVGKAPVEVPDQVGFVVNRLLFPYLFDAVRLMESTGMPAEDVDRCMTLGAGHPMGPLRLLDLVGLDVAAAIGNSLHAATGDPARRPPDRLLGMVAEGRLGRKSGSGFYEYG